MDDVTSDRLDCALQSVLAHLDDTERAGRLGLRLARVDRPTDLGYQRYTPSVSVVLAGRKRSIVGDDD